MLRNGSCSGTGRFFVGTFNSRQQLDAKGVAMPKGTETIEVVFVAGNFFDHVEFKGDQKTLAPDTRAQKK